MVGERQRHPAWAVVAKLYRSNGRTALLVVVALMILLGGSIYWVSKRISSVSGDSANVSPSPTGSEIFQPKVRLPSRAVIGADGLISTLPDAYAAVSSSVPEELNSPSVVPDRNSLFKGAEVEDKQTYLWNLFTPNVGRHLKISVVRYGSVKSAREFYARDRREHSDAHFTVGEDDEVPWITNNGPARAIDGLGDEAFAVSTRQEGMLVTEVDNRGRVYDTGGVIVDARHKNVLVLLEFNGADYPGNEPSDKHVKGTNLSFGETRTAAVKMVEAILRVLRG